MCEVVHKHSRQPRRSLATAPVSILGRGYSWLAAWSEGLNPHQAVAEAIEWLQVRLPR